MNNDNVDKANVFLWGHFGKKLQKLDNERYLAITQNSPNEFLSRIYNNRMEKIINKLCGDENKIDKLFDEMENENYLDNLFRQVSAYMRNTSEIAVGSALTGELEKSINLGRIVKVKEKGDEVEN